MSNANDARRAPDGLIVHKDSPLYSSLAELAGRARLVFFAGLPGTGKSLLINQLAQIAHASGRRLTLLQWDVARPAFEASAAGQRYPQLNGVTHGLIRVAVGRWARQAVAQWHAQHPGVESMLIGETPFVGNRFVELARPMDDAAEPVLSAESARFVIPVPSREVRRHLEAERERRALRPLHEREKEDAPPHVLREHWRELVSVAQAVGIASPAANTDGDVPYDPLTYRRVYEHVLRWRRTQILSQDVILPANAFSAYDFRVPSENLLPTPDETDYFMRAIEAAYPDLNVLQREIARWYEVSEE